MENELQQPPPEPVNNAESACLPTSASLSSHEETPPTANLYSDLKDGEIRLFELDLDTTRNIVGRLQTVDMPSAPPFYALSYVCGNDACSEEITIDDRAFLVKPNLFAALKVLRVFFQGRRSTQVAIWIDAICIDQVNEEEKAKQIRSMNSVFSEALEVWVWLGAVDDNIRMLLRVFAWIWLYWDIGPDSDAFRQHGNEPRHHESITESTMGALDSLSRRQRRLELHHRVSHANLCAMACFLATLGWVLNDKDITQGYGDSFKETIRIAMNVPILDAGLFPLDHVFWATLYNFVNLEWFGRTWTYQEILLAWEAKLIVQGISVPWKIVLHIMDVLLSALTFPEILNERSRDSRTRHLPPLVKRVELRVQWFQFHSHLPPFANSLPVLLSLIFTQRRVSTIPKDKIYGLLALWRKKIQAEIIIDYTRETAAVFAHAVKLGLDGETPLTIADLWTAFEGPSIALGTDGLPSWCPDFQNPPNFQGNGRFMPLSFAVRDQIQAFARYEHTSGFETLAIRVLKLDRISRRMETACPQISHLTDEPYSALVAWLQKLPGHLPSEHQACRSLGRDLQTRFYEDAESLHSSEFTFGHFSNGIERLLYVPPWQLADALQDVVVRLTLDALSHQSGRFLFSTDSGRIGHSLRQPCLDGHIILVPCSDPRSVSHMLTADCTHYVGCATVFGLMGDSLLDSLDDMETKWKMVCLR